MSPGTCNDCGAAFKGDVKAHVADAHPGLPRFRFRDEKGVSWLICADCGHKVQEGSAQHMKSAGPYTAGKSSDPIDLFSVHQMSHEGEA